MSYWLAAVDSTTKRLPQSVEDALADAIVAPVVGTSLRSKGASGVATDDATGAVQAAAAVVAKGSGVPAVQIAADAGTYRITSTILFDRIAPKIAGAGVGNPGDHANPGKGTTFIWDGPAGQPMFRFRDCQNVVFEDVLLLGNDNTPPSELIFFENDGSSGQVGTNQMISFTRVTFGRYGYANTTYPGHSKTQRCVRFGGTNVNNDQAWFHDCQFGGASDALVAFDNSNTLWCNFINPYFDGRSMDDLVTPTATGLRTNACVVLINPQFNRCNPDIDVQNGMANVYMWNSENSAQFARIGNSAGLLAHAGAMVAHSSTMGANMFDATALGTDGELSLTDIRFRTALPMWPKIKVRGSASTLAGRVVVRDCGLPADVYDIQAHATGSGGVIVRIDDGDLLVRRHLLAGATLSGIEKMPLRVGGYAADGSAATDIAARLAAAGLVQNTTQTARVIRTNALVNPRFASSSTGWTKSANVTPSTVGTTVALLLTADITAGNSLIYNTAAAAAVAGDAWSAGVTVTMTGNATRQRLRLQVNSYNGNTICGSQTVEFAPGETKRLYVDGAVVAAGDTSVRMVLSAIDATLPAGVTVTLSDPVLEKAPVSGVPFHGASTVPNWSAAWTATADNSTSTLTPAATPTSPDVQVFTAAGTWTKPPGAVAVHMLTVAGGSGGGSGRRGAAGTVRCGGGGGGGGGITQRTVAAALCAATETVTVGAGGAGGAAVTANDTDGNPGSAGGSSSFGAHAKSNAPGAGSGGTSSAGTAGSAGSALVFGGAGGAASATGGTGVVSAVVGAATGGGGGGGITSANAASAGGNGGTCASTGRASSSGAAADASASPAPDSPTSTGEPGGGGGGGGGSITGAGGAGASGALYGGGGGGGGASLNGNNSGKGGDGAAGIVIVTTYF